RTFTTRTSTRRSSIRSRLRRSTRRSRVSTIPGGRPTRRMWRSSPPRSLGATTHLKKKTTTRLSRSPPASSASAPIRAVSHESPLLVGPRQLVGLDQPEGGERVQCRGFHCEQCRGGIQQPSDQQSEEWEHDE